MRQKSITLTNTGMNRDLSISKTDKTTAYENYNVRIIARDEDTLLSVTNERGNIVYELTGQIAGELVGWNVLNGHIILFTHENSGTNPDHIYRVDYKDDDTTGGSGSDFVTVTPAIIRFNKDGGSVTINIRGTYSSWSVTSAPEWTDANGKSGSASTLVVNAEANSEQAARSGYIVFSVDGVNYTVSVNQASASAILYVTPETVSGGTNEFGKLMTVSDEGHMGWKLSTTTSWIHFGSAVSGVSSGNTGIVILDKTETTGNGNGQTRIYIDPNTSGSSRTGIVYLYDAGGQLWQTVTVTQSA